MGGDCSKLKQQHHRYSDIAPDLIAYMADCRGDEYLKAFDSTLQKHCIGVILTFSVDAGAPSISLDSLRKLADCILKTNKQMGNFILKNEKDMFGKVELFEFVKRYLRKSDQDVEDCNTLVKYLNSYLMIQLDDKHRERRRDEKEMLKKLGDFKTAAVPFKQGGLASFVNKIDQRQSCMLKDLQAMKSKLDNKSNKIKDWKIVYNIFFGVISATTLICSVVAAALTSSPFVTALTAVAAAGSQLAPMGGWINSLWKKYENAVEGQRKKMKTSSLVYGTSTGKCELDSIGVLVDKLEKRMLLRTSSDGKKENAVIRTIEDEIQEKLRVFKNPIEDLIKHIDKCRGDIEMGKNKIMAIIKSRNKSTPWYLKI